MEWQPIESAPKDKTRCLIWTKHGTLAEFGYATVASFREYVAGQPDWRSDGGARMWPTHWMPLPEPPAA